MKAEMMVRLGAWLACIVSVGCARDARNNAPDAAPVMTPASGESSKAPLPEPSSYIVVEESVRTTCNLPNDQEKAPKFDFDEAKLRPRGEGILDGVARCLTDGPMKGQSITIVGHADPRGSEDYNQQLGRRRAESARDYLTEHGLGADRIRVQSVGESAATGSDASGWAVDRRIEVRRGDAAP